MYSNKMLERSIIISAHPDDEVLWFSSILDKVDGVVVCFLDCKSKPVLGPGRKRSLSDYPLRNVSCLEIDESEAFNGADWKNPVITKIGLEISNKNISDKKYQENYVKLRDGLRNKLIGCYNVFTHNPWGEYGHEDHVQIYRVVKELQTEIKFNLWFTNYCSNRSVNLMLRYISGFDSEYVTLKTNKILASSIKNLYLKNRCWTWYDDWEWFNEESFMEDKSSQERLHAYGHIFPLNLIKVEY
ncbi:MAG: PIG-L family deacetylase [Planctomycetia bacterium]|nr:PIG-L family deacetylase [Candidatus Brocadia sp.]QOJ06498.1 MAG: PIG-L family deacetylase [Planctomycetia bacterium]HQU31702.1 PIG-L family deacetylase [Candidatus Brocadia sapporoensis]